MLPLIHQLDHFQTIYPAYILNLERAKDLERELRKRNTVFRNFIEVCVHISYLISLFQPALMYALHRSAQEHQQEQGATIAVLNLCLLSLRSGYLDIDSC